MVTERSELLTDLSNGQFGFKSFARSSQKLNSKTFKLSGRLSIRPGEETVSIQIIYIVITI